MYDFSGAILSKGFLFCQAPTKITYFVILSRTVYEIK